MKLKSNLLLQQVKPPTMWSCWFSFTTSMTRVLNAFNSSFKKWEMENELLYGKGKTLVNISPVVNEKSLQKRPGLARRTSKGFDRRSSPTWIQVALVFFWAREDWIQKGRKKRGVSLKDRLKNDHERTEDWVIMRWNLRCAMHVRNEITAS